MLCLYVHLCKHSIPSSLITPTEISGVTCSHLFAFKLTKQKLYTLWIKVNRLCVCVCVCVCVWGWVCACVCVCVCVSVYGVGEFRQIPQRLRIVINYPLGGVPLSRRKQC